MKEHTLYKIEDLLCEELESFGEKDRIGGSGELQMLDTVLHATKNLYKIMDSMDESSYSRNDGNSSYYSRRGGSYGREGSYRYSRDDGGSYDRGSYRGESSYRRKRDSMGRFSRSSGSGMVDRLKDMMDETEDPKEREELQEFISGIEHRG